jgi:hypothetical protein
MVMVTKMNRRAVAALFVICSMSGCSFGENRDGPVGEIVVNFQRGGGSHLPFAADSALIRVWDRSNGSSKVTAYSIPSNVSTSASIPVSAYVGSLYQVDVLAFHNVGGDHRVVLAAAEAQGVSVSARGTTPMFFTIDPWIVTLFVSSPIVAGDQCTISLSFNGGAPTDDILTGHGKLYYSIGPNGDRQSVDVDLQHAAAGATITVPTSASDTALYVQFSFDVNQDNFDASNDAFTADIPETVAGEELFRIPVSAASGRVVSGH